MPKFEVVLVFIPIHQIIDLFLQYAIKSQSDQFRC